MPRQVAALGVVFLFAHLVYLPGTLEDIDSINFALGVREFEVAQHQPHPPGYPVFIALAKGASAVAGAVGAAAPVPAGLALVGVLSGALLVPILYALFRRLDAGLAWWATVATVCSPLFWFTALRPLSDMAGLLWAVSAQALLVSVCLARRGTDDDAALSVDRAMASPAARLLAGAVLAGLATGVRSQNAVLTGPLLVAALVWPRTGLTMGHRAAAVVAAGIAVLAWAVPLVVVSGGLGEYLAALGAQGGEDFTGVVMLWTTPHPRVAIDALLNSFVWPWGALIPGLLVCVMAAAGLVRLARRAPPVLATLAIAFGPYLVFHLLFHETPTLRYALPLVAPSVFLVLYGVAGSSPVAPAVAGTAVALASLAFALPAVHVYARDGSPAFRVIDAAVETDGARSEDGPRTVLGMHAVMRRVEEWQPSVHERGVLRAPHGREWLALVEHWRARPDSPVDFVADPRRTDLVLFDPHARRLAASARWTFRETPFVAGARPGPADLYSMAPPGWMLDRGWALTAEVGGVTAAHGLGPHVQPSVAWIRARREPGTLVLGGRNLGGDGSRVRLVVAIGSCEVDSWEVVPGSFFRRIVVPAGPLDGSGYLPMSVAAVAPAGSSAPAAVALEQFDLQPEGVPMIGFLDGWHEPEYQPATARAWRWMSERANVWVRPVGRDITLRIAGESPRRYFDRSPVVRIVSGGVEVARVQPGDDFIEEVRIPSAVLDASDGIVSFESDLWFSPAARGQSADERHLALRIFRVEVR